MSNLRLCGRQNGFLSALPYFCSVPVSLLSGVAADWLIMRQVFSITNVRKIFTFTGQCGYFFSLNRLATGLPWRYSSPHRPGAAGALPHRRLLRRMQPHPHRHLPHALHQLRRDQLRRSLRQPDRHRSPVGARCHGNRFNSNMES